MGFCTHCGKEITEESVIHLSGITACKNCGCPVRFEVVEKTPITYSVKLIDVGDDGFMVSSVISEHANISYSQAKRVISRIPNVTFKFKNPEQAKRFVKALHKVGAEAKITVNNGEGEI